MTPDFGVITPRFQVEPGSAIQAALPQICPEAEPPNARSQAKPEERGVL